MFRDKALVSPQRPKKRVTLARQDTFDLENEDLVPRKNLNGRAKSSHGIKAILERADTMSSLAPEVREYLEAHMRMMGEEKVHCDLNLGQFGIVALTGGMIKSKNFDVIRLGVGKHINESKGSFAIYRVDPPYKAITNHGFGKKTVSSFQNTK